MYIRCSLEKFYLLHKSCYSGIILHVPAASASRVSPFSSFLQLLAAEICNIRTSFIFHDS